MMTGAALHRRSRWQLRLALLAAFVCISATSLHPQPMPTTLHSAARLQLKPRAAPREHVARLRGGRGIEDTSTGGAGEPHSLRFFCGTWNVNGKPPSVPLEEWLFPHSDGDDVDVYVLGLQEVQDLSGTQALITDEEKGRQWSMNIQRTLGAPQRYQFVAARQMVGIYLCVLVRTELAPHLSDVKIMELGTGFLQQGGNKGGVAARFTLHGARICVVSSHLAAQTANTEKRNKDYRELVRRLDFNLADETPAVKQEDLFVMPDIAPPLDGDGASGAVKINPAIKKTRSGVFGSAVNLAQLSSFWDSAKKDAEGGEKKQGGKPARDALGILDHDLVLWVGDLNYRFNLPEQAVLGLVEERNWKMLYEFDQLNIAKKAGDSFHGFIEPPLGFVPTYKYERWGTGFAHKEEGKGLKRTPAWCDRVLYRPINPLLSTECEAYRRHEVLGSDHRPVSALLHVTLPGSAALKAARAEVKVEEEVGEVQSEVDGVSSAVVESDAEGWAVLPPTKRPTLPDKQHQHHLDLPTKHALMPSVSNLTASVELYDTSSEILLVPITSDGGPALSVDKRSQKAQWIPADDAALRKKIAKWTPKHMVHGTLGIAKLSFASYLVVVTKVVGVGSLEQGAVHAVAETEVLPVSVGPPVPESEEEKRAVDDREYGMLKDMLVGWNLFFSRDFDATQTQQRIARNADDGCGGIDGAFVWNANMLAHLGQPPEHTPNASRDKLARLLVIIPAVCGFFQELETELQGQSLKLALISRRSRHRAGVRFFSRGIDADGHVSNFVETEQVLMSDTGTSSYVVVRGSIPLFWQEGEALVTLKPTPTLIKDKPHHEAMGKHLGELAARYKRVSMLSLIDTSGVEGPISQSFKATAQPFVERGSGAGKDSDVAFTEFDFHKVCGKTASPAAAVGVAMLLDAMEGMTPENLFLRLRKRGGGWEKSVEQGTVFRVNCIDCLDRTNVVQAAMASRMLIEQLMAHALIEPGEYEACMFAARNGYVPPLPLMSKMLRVMWADMGDAVSVQYAGTGALKGDFTRSGKRTIKGIFSDGIANVRRAMQNNFADGFRQQVIDLVHGVAVRAPGQPIAPALQQAAGIGMDGIEDVDVTEEEEELLEEEEEAEEMGVGAAGWEEGAETGEEGSRAAGWEGEEEEEWRMGSEDDLGEPPMYT